MAFGTTLARNRSPGPAGTTLFVLRPPLRSGGTSCRGRVRPYMRGLRDWMGRGIGATRQPRRRVLGRPMWGRV